MNRLERTAQRVAQEAGRILRADVVVLRDGQPIARTVPGGDAPDTTAAPTINFSWDDEASQMDIAVYDGGPPISEELTRSVLGLVIEREMMRDSLSSSDEAKDRVLRNLLFEEAADLTEVLRLNRLLDLHLERPRSVLLVDASEYVDGAGDAGGERAGADPARRRIRSLVAAIAIFFRLPDETICVHLQGGLVAVLKACTTADLAQWSEASAGDGSASWANLDALKRAASDLRRFLEERFQVRVDVAVGRYHPGLQGLHTSYEDCRLALRLGRVTRPGSMHSLDELGLPALLAVPDDGTKRSLAARLIGPLMQEPDILPTLHAFFAENCSSNVTARKLAIHRNTLSYRLDKVAVLTGLDPRRFNDAIQLRISLELADTPATPSHD